MYLNKVFVLGNLTRDPELKSLPSGMQVCNFGLATNRSYKDRDGNKQEQTEFHNVVAFGRSAELIAQYMQKGRQLLVEGRIQTRSWEQDGQKRYRTEIIVDQFQVKTFDSDIWCGHTAALPVGNPHFQVGKSSRP